MNSRHPETPAHGWGGSEPQLLTPLWLDPLDPVDPVDPLDPRREFLTPDSARDILSILALGGLAGCPNNKRPKLFHTFLLQPLKNLRKIKVLCLWGPCPKAKGVLAGPGTPRDPKSDVFVTKWVAIQPFGTFYARLDAEFRPGARQIGPTLSISIFFAHFGSNNLEKCKF